MLHPEVFSFFDEPTNTASYVLKDPATKAAAIIDSVLDFDAASGRTSTKAADEIIAHELLERGCEYVAMAGYMRMVHTPLLAAFPNRVVNLHPALLPSFTGAHAIDDAFARGVKVTGVTVHFANEVYDNGPIIAQRALAVEEGWDVDTLEEHIHAIEHVLYPEVVQMLADGRVHVLESGKVAIDAPRG